MICHVPTAVHTGGRVQIVRVAGCSAFFTAANFNQLASKREPVAPSSVLRKLGTSQDSAAQVRLMSQHQNLPACRQTITLQDAAAQVQSMAICPFHAPHLEALCGWAVQTPPGLLKLRCNKGSQRLQPHWHSLRLSWKGQNGILS